MQATSIEWADMTWNPVSGCTKVSTGCKNCYAETIHKRFHKQLGEFNKINVHPEKLTEPLRHKKPKRIFVNSMSDLFHEDVPFEFIDRVFSAMAVCKQHNFIILTKRPERMLEYMAYTCHFYDYPTAETSARVWNIALDNYSKYERTWPLPNVWLGVSVENQEQANQRIPIMVRVPAAVRFLSCEPLLSGIDLTRIHTQNQYGDNFYHNVLSGASIMEGFGECNFQNTIHWVIAGGESGHHARPMHPEWVRSLRDQCARAAVPFFFKQWGAWLPIRMPLTTSQIHVLPNYSKKLYKEFEHHDMTYVKVGKKKAGNTLDGQQHLEFPNTQNH